MCPACTLPHLSLGQAVRLGTSINCSRTKSNQSFLKKKAGFILAFEQTSVPARIELLLLNVSCTKPQQVVTLNFVSTITCFGQGAYHGICILLQQICMLKSQWRLFSGDMECWEWIIVDLSTVSGTPSRLPQIITRYNIDMDCIHLMCLEVSSLVVYLRELYSPVQLYKCHHIVAQCPGLEPTA